MISIFFHVACIGTHWLQITDEILSNVLDSSLYDLVKECNIVVVGDVASKNMIIEKYSTYSKMKFHYSGSDIQQYEFPSIKLLSKYCQENPLDKVFYCHTKGTSKDYSNPYWKYWRRYMIKSCITEHVKHISALDKYDVSGNMWTNGTHYSGNFWWANAAHVNQLPSIADLEKSPEVIWDGHTYEETKRLQCEMWIGKKRGIKVREHGILNMHPSFGEAVVGDVDAFPCPLNSMNFDKIYLINLTHRTDRYKQAIENINGIGLHNVVRFPAINAKHLGLTKKGLDNPGLIGCFLSHYFIFQEAVVNGYERILVFEDDVTFVNGFNERLAYALDQLPTNWDFVYLGYTERNGMYTYKNKFSPNLAIPNDPWGTQAYMVQGDAIKMIYDHLQSLNDHVDIQLSREIMPKLKAFELFPPLCPQSGSSSDISGPHIEIKVPKAKSIRRNFRPIFN